MEAIVQIIGILGRAGLTIAGNLQSVKFDKKMLADANMIVDVLSSIPSPSDIASLVVKK